MVASDWRHGALAQPGPFNQQKQLPVTSPANTIIYVPGLKPKPPAELHRANLWRALLEGLRRTHPDIASEMGSQPGCFQLVTWPHIFYPEPSNPEVDQAGLERLLALSGPTAEDIDEARNWRKQLAQLIYLVCDTFPWLIDRVADPNLQAVLHDSLRYLRNEDGIGVRIRGMVADALRAAHQTDSRILLVAHSLGSVIAWDVLWEFSRRWQEPLRVDMFLTLGSPLGLNFIRHRLLGHQHRGARQYPDNIRRWTNLSAVGELTALDRKFANDYRGMLRHGLVEFISDDTSLLNYFRGPAGLNVHKCYGYMINPRTAEVVADWWAEGRPR